MGQVVDPQQTALPGGAKRIHHFGQASHTDAVVVEVAGRQGVEHGGDPRRRDLRIVRQHRRQRRPGHARPGREVALQIVGVQIDQTRKKPVASDIDRAGRTASGFPDVGDFAAAHAQRAVDRIVGQDDPRVGQDLFVRHAATLERGAICTARVTTS